MAVRQGGVVDRCCGRRIKQVFASLTSPAADWLFMVGLLGIGVALALGIGMRIAAASGALLLTLMWAAELPLANNPFVHNHIIESILLIAPAVYGAGRTLGLGRRWEQLPLVQRLLKYHRSHSRTRGGHPAALLRRPNRARAGR